MFFTQYQLPATPVNTPISSSSVQLLPIYLPISSMWHKRNNSILLLSCLLTSLTSSHTFIYSVLQRWLYATRRGRYIFLSSPLPSRTAHAIVQSFIHLCIILLLCRLSHCYLAFSIVVFFSSLSLCSRQTYCPSCFRMSSFFAVGFLPLLQAVVSVWECNVHILQ